MSEARPGPFTAKRQRVFHGTMTALWLAMVPIALATGWIESIVFISAISIYANFAAHFAAWEAAHDDG